MVKKKKKKRRSVGGGDSNASSTATTPVKPTGHQLRPGSLSASAAASAASSPSKTPRKRLHDVGSTWRLVDIHKAFAKEEDVPTADRLGNKIYLNPKAMDARNFYMGQVIVVFKVEDPEAGTHRTQERCRKGAVGTVWPSRELASVDIAMSNMIRFSAGAGLLDPVGIQAAKEESFAFAREVSLVPQVKHMPSWMSSDVFRSYVHHYIREWCFLQGAVVDIRYQGRLHRFTIYDADTQSRTDSNHQQQQPQGRRSAAIVDTAEQKMEPENSINKGADIDNNDGDNDEAFAARMQQMSLADKSATRLRQQAAWDVFRVTRVTRISIETQDIRERKLEKQSQSQKNKVTYKSIGGLSRQLRTIREMVELPLRSPELYERFGVARPAGVLLVGPPGTGKTLIAKAVANECGAYILNIDGAEVMSKYYGETEAKLAGIFEEARRNSPALIFIDEIDALCPSRDSAPNELEKRVVSTLLALMDGVNSDGSCHLFVLGATNRADSLDPALRRPGRFDRELEIGVPNAVDRYEILSVLLKGVPHDIAKNEIEAFASNLHGYVGADLAAVVKEAGLLAIQHKLRNDRQSTAGSGGNKITLLDLTDALAEVRPSCMREVHLEVPQVKWTDIGGQETTKQSLREAVEWPLKHPEAFLRLGIQPPRGLLLYGPPGCSKTMMAKALATESKLNFLAVKGPELFSKWVGESERAVREVFRKARAAAPSIIFFDEIDALAVQRGQSSGSSVGDRVITQLLTEMDGIESLTNVVVVAATNRPDLIDSALLRPGRIDRRIYVPPPDVDARKEIFRIQLVKIPHQENVTPLELAKLCEGFSGAEIAAVCRQAALTAMRRDPENADVVSFEDFQAAISNTAKNITPDMIEFYDNYQKQFRRKP